MQTKLTQNTAILIFANSAAKDSHDKNIVVDIGLFDVLTQHTIKLVKSVGLPYFHFTEKEQIGDTFGERFANAIASVYENGFENIITLGNDCPQLKSWHLRKAFRELQQGNTVLGPSMDGGFYLMGINRKRFDKLSFSKLPWQTAKLFKETKIALDCEGAHLFALPRLNDLDSQKDVVLLSSFVRSITLVVLTALRKLLSFCRVIRREIYALVEYRHTSNLHNKGSPTLLFS